MDKRKNTTINWKAIIAIGLIIVFIGYYIIGFINKPKRHNVTKSNVSNTTTNTNNSPDPSVIEPQFIKQGELRFLRGKDRTEISKIDIEIADNDSKRMQGLMYRKSMQEKQGMLFIFPYSEPQNFWMKNTYISLDIIYIDEDRKIVTIGRNTKTLSEENIPSVYDAQFVVEVNAGYCDKNGIKEGDYVSF